MLKLLAAPDPAPAVASMASTGALVAIMPGAAPQPLAVLVHLEQTHGIVPDGLRRLAVLGGERDRLRLSKDAMRYLSAVSDGSDMLETAYRHGAAVGRDALLIRAATVGAQVTEDELEQVAVAAEQVFPLKAADLMPALTGPELGEALKRAERRWIASGFTLSKADLID